MIKHICFNCKEASKRTVDTFVETNCDHFPPVRQQVDGDVTECEKFIPKEKKK